MPNATRLLALVPGFYKSFKLIFALYTNIYIVFSIGIFLVTTIKPKTFGFELYKIRLFRYRFITYITYNTFTLHIINPFCKSQHRDHQRFRISYYTRYSSHHRQDRNQSYTVFQSLNYSPVLYIYLPEYLFR